MRRISFCKSETSSRHGVTNLSPEGKHLYSCEYGSTSCVWYVACMLHMYGSMKHLYFCEYGSTSCVWYVACMYPAVFSPRCM